VIGVCRPEQRALALALGGQPQLFGALGLLPPLSLSLRKLPFLVLQPPRVAAQLEVVVLRGMGVAPVAAGADRHAAGAMAESVAV
jgi:hypothetical protein